MINQKIKIVFFILLFCATPFFSQLKHAKITHKKKSITEVKKIKKKETYVDKMLRETRESMNQFEYTLSFNNKESLFKEVSKMSLDNNNSMSFKISRLFGDTEGSFYVDRKTGKTFHLKEFEVDFFLVQNDEITD
jgi:GLPGLI family protein